MLRWLTLLAAALLSGARAEPPVTDYKVAVILVRFPDKPQPSWAGRAVAASIARFRSEVLNNSFGKVRVVHSTFGWYTLATAAGSECPREVMHSEGKAAVEAQRGPGALDGFIELYVTQDVNCLGDLMGHGFPGRAFVYAGNNPSTIAHELWHAVGRPHSRSRSCSTEGCTVSEYGDSYCRMGAGSATQHLNAPQKEDVGWLNRPGFPSIQLVTRSGSFRIEPYESIVGEQSIKALKVPTGRKDGLGRDIHYFVESRTMAGRGLVLLHTASSGAGHPLSVFLIDVAPATNEFEAVLDAGQSFRDQDAGLVFTTVSASGSGSVVQVDLPAPR
jgi:hypothetical protein